MLIVDSYKSLSVKPGFVLRAYQYRAGGNGNGVVWALPVDAPFPEPSDCEPMEDLFLKPPRPAGGLDDFMEVITGTGRARAYFSASLLKRGLEELGAMWHGCGWSDHMMLLDNPVPPGEAEYWSWESPAPEDWRPEVRGEADWVEVVFYTFKQMELEAIYRHVDRYARGVYVSCSERVTIATGRPGPIY